jgi:hypothetical protein
MMWPTKRCPKGVKFKTLRSYMSAIKSEILRDGRFPDPFTGPGTERIQRALRAVKRMTGSRPKPKRPITVSLLELLREVIDRTTYEGATLWAALCTGVHGCFRSGELFPEKGLCWKDVRFAPQDAYLVVHLDTSKTDPWGDGVDRVVFATHDATCPVAALRALTAFQHSQGPEIAVFSTRGGKPRWSKRQFVNCLKESVAKLAARRPDLDLLSANYAGHSMRRGGATSLAMRGVPVWLIKAIGYWKSDCFMTYIEPALKYKGTVADAMRIRSSEVRSMELNAAGREPAGFGWLDEDPDEEATEQIATSEDAKRPEPASAPPHPEEESKAGPVRSL